MRNESPIAVDNNATCTVQCAMNTITSIFALKKARASGRNVGKVFNPVLKLVFENYSCLSQLRSPHFTYVLLVASRPEVYTAHIYVLTSFIFPFKYQ